MKLKKNDNVMVVTGKDRGKTGLIERVFPALNKVVVKGIGISKKHLKPSRKNPSGGIIEINQKIDISNVMIICPSCGKPSRARYNMTDKNKLRICRRCEASLEGGSK